MEERINKFINGQKVLTMCTAIENQPYCATCFYAFDEENKVLIFASDDHTNHIQQALANPKVSGTINKETTTVAKIQGIQFTGDFIAPDDELAQSFYKIYYKRFPFANAKPSPIWGIQLDWIKMTDNTLGFGKKLVWERG